MIRVKHTRTHTTPIVNETYPSGVEKGIKSYSDVLVTDAELVLVECKPEEALIVFGKPNHNYKPILISRTEKISSNVGKVMGDWSYNSLYKKIFQMNGDVTGYDFKILALPEHFSPSSLQDILDGKLKEDKVVVECEYIQTEVGSAKGWDGAVDGVWCGTVIKLNSSNHVTIYPVEETLTYQQWIDKYRDQLFGIPKEKISTNPKIQVSK